jgi:tripartite-type tricarboxylate transporter receptor subunit TctC
MRSALTRVFIFVLGLSLLFGVCSHNLSWAQEGYPSKPIKVIIPRDPGGASDLAVRVMTDYLSQELKQPIVIENKAGAGGLIGISEVNRAKPDGYTLLSVADSGMILAPMESPNPPFDTFKDFLPICAFGGTPVAFGVHQSSPFKTLADFVKEAKARPGTLNVAVTSLGNENHLTFEIFRKVAAVNLKLVPFKGTGEAIAALLGKHMDMLVLTFVGFQPYVKSNEVRLLVIGPSFPGVSVPNFTEAGYNDPRLKSLLNRYNTFMVSSKTPKPIYDKLVSTFKQVATNPELIKKWETIGVIPDYLGPAELTKFMKEKWDVCSLLLDELGLKKK